MPAATPLEQRFWPKVSGGDYTECWTWTANLLPGGYGRIWSGGRSLLAHRVAYELMVGEIPGGLDIDHLCRNRGCVNPWHLEPVTRKVNQHRQPGFFANRTHCAHGHEYDAANTYWRPDGTGRGCRVCIARRSRDARAA